MVSSTRFFAVAEDITYGVASYISLDIFDSSVDWNKHMAWPDPSCSLRESTSVISSNKDRIHSLVVYGSQRLVLNTLRLRDGSLIGNVYASNETDCIKASAMRFNGDKIYMLTTCSDFHFLIYNTITSQFTIHKSVSPNPHWPYWE